MIVDTKPLLVDSEPWFVRKTKKRLGQHYSRLRATELLYSPIINKLTELGCDDLSDTIDLGTMAYHGLRVRVLWIARNYIKAVHLC